jgi:hypothetical protein
MAATHSRNHPSPDSAPPLYILPLSAHTMREGLRNFKKPGTCQPYCVPYSMS